MRNAKKMTGKHYLTKLIVFAVECFFSEIFASPSGILASCRK